MSDHERIVGLVVTVGEIAHVVTEYEDTHLPSTVGHDMLRSGLVQLVGLAAEWLEHLDAEAVGR